MIRIWGRLNSVNVQKVVWALEECGAAYERIDAGMAFGIVKTNEYLAKNPNALIPTLEDDGFVLWESNAIVRYIAAKFPQSGLMPADIRLRADADRWMDWQQTTYVGSMGPAFMQLIRMKPEDRSQPVIDASIASAEAQTAILDAALKDRPFITGDTLTMGDIALGPSTHRWLNMPIRRPARPYLEAWYKRLCARPGVAKTFLLPLT